MAQPTIAFKRAMAAVRFNLEQAQVADHARIAELVDTALRAVAGGCEVYVPRGRFQIVQERHTRVVELHRAGMGWREIRRETGYSERQIYAIVAKRASGF